MRKGKKRHVTVNECFEKGGAELERKEGDKEQCGRGEGVRRKGGERRQIGLSIGAPRNGDTGERKINGPAGEGCLGRGHQGKKKEEKHKLKLEVCSNKKRGKRDQWEWTGEKCHHPPQKKNERTRGGKKEKGKKKKKTLKAIEGEGQGNRERPGGESTLTSRDRHTRNPARQDLGKRGGERGKKKGGEGKRIECTALSPR